MKTRCFLILASMAVASFAFGQAKDYPNRPIRVIVGTAPGSSADTGARFFSELLSPVLGQPFVVENRPGADGVVGILAVKNSPADGYTLLLGSNSPLSVNPVVMKNLPYDPVKDLKPVYGIRKGMNVFVVAPDSPLNSLPDLVSAAKKAKQPLNAGTSLANYRISVEWFGLLAGVKFNNVPYKGTAQVMTDVVGHHIDFGFVDRAVAAPLFQYGKLKALAVAGEHRYPGNPDVPTVIESGYPEFESYAWTAFYIRAETPEDVMIPLVKAMQQVMASSAAKEYIFKGGQEPMALGPDAMRQFQLKELARIKHVVEAVGIKPE